MKTLLVHASISGVGFNSLGKTNESTWISHGLPSISAYAKSKGFPVSLIDLRGLKGWSDFEEVIRKEKPDVVGLGMLTVDFNHVMKCIEIIKEVNPDIKTVVGGAHPTLMLHEVESNPLIDYIILGEGEISFTELLKKISSCKPSPRIIQGIKPDLDKIPFIDRELYSHQEKNIEGFPDPLMTIIAGRGCIYNCRFCQPAERIIFGLPVRRRSVDNVIEELKILRDKYNFQTLFIHDDCLTEDRDWIYEFCEKYQANGFTQPFICQSRVDIICRYEDMVKKMQQVGLSMFIMGFESGSQRVLDFLRKGTKVEQNYQAAKICKKYGIKVWANYMFGVPTETKEEVRATVKMIKKIKPHHCAPSFFTPYPGSDLYTYCQEHNLSLIKNHEDYRRNVGGAKIKGVDYEFLMQAYRESMLAELNIKDKIVKIIKNQIKKSKLGRKAIKFGKQILK